MAAFSASFAVKKFAKVGGVTFGTQTPNAGLVEIRVAELNDWDSWAELENQIKRLVDAMREGRGRGSGIASVGAQIQDQFDEKV